MLRISTNELNGREPTYIDFPTIMMIEVVRVIFYLNRLHNISLRITIDATSSVSILQEDIVFGLVNMIEEC